MRTASAPATFAFSRSSSSVKKPLARSGADVAARAALRSSSEPPKRSSTRIEIAAAPAFANCAASRAGSASGRRSPGGGRAPLDLGNRGEAWRGESSRGIGPSGGHASRARRRSAARAVLPAAPESIVRARDLETFAQGPRRDRSAAIAPAALSRIASRRAAVLRRRTPAGSLPRSRRDSRRAARRCCSAECRARPPDPARVRRTSPSTTSRDEVRADRRELVDAAAAVHDVRTASTQPREHLRDRSHELGRVDADDLRPGARRIRQRPEHVEDRPGRELFAHGCSVPHRRMVRRSEEKAEAELVDGLRDPTAARARG